MSLCQTCDEPLVLRLDDDTDDESTKVERTVPDDLELRCGCHFHWECLMEEASSIATSLGCPSCESYLPENEAASSSASSHSNKVASSAAILAQYINEGGLQQNLDIMQSLTEEAYVQTHPEARPARAFHVMCAEGDIAGIVDLLRDVSDQGEDVGSIIRYQDPLAEMKCSLHLAVENQQEEIVWTLLWLCSSVPTELFPIVVRQTAGDLGLGRLAVQADTDIRGMRDYQGRTAETIGKQNPGSLGNLLDAGVLSP